MSTAIEASEKNLDSVFCKDYVFKIPVYQRPYAWETEQVEELFDDLLDAMKTDEKEPYFLGSIVLVKRNTEAPDSDVVDGQQRLTTLTILLCVLRELCEGAWQRDLDDRIRLKRDVVADREEVVLLRLKDSDQEYFQTYVQSTGGIGKLLRGLPRAKTDSQTRILENAELLYKQVSELQPRDREALAKFVIQRCYLVIVGTSSQSSAYRVFSVMNDRGLELAPTDILKAEITGLIENERARERYAKRWEVIEEHLGRNRFLELFSHVRMIYAKEKQRRNLQDEFKEYVLSDANGRKFVEDVLEPYAAAYEKTLGMSNGLPEDATVYLKHLSRLDNSDWIPPAMALYFDPPSDEAQTLEIVRRLERLAYGLFIRRANVNQRIKRFAAVIQAIQRRNRDALWAALELSAEEKVEISEALDGPIYKMTRVRKPLLLRLDGLMAGSGASYSHPTITIEHVLPQNPELDSEWIKWFPDEQERDNWTHRLANLVLLSRRKNVRASNFGFSRKKKEYFHREGITPFSLTVPVLGTNEWTSDVLLKRQAALLKMLRDEWQL